MIPFEREAFIDAFTSDVTNSLFSCECGTMFNDEENYELHDRIKILSIDDALYAHVCTCWIDKANRIHDFLMHHGKPVTKYIHVAVSNFKDSLPSSEDTKKAIDSFSSKPSHSI